MALLAPCAVACVDATCDLVRLLERAKSEDATAAWWFGLFCTYPVPSLILSLTSA